MTFRERQDHWRSERLRLLKEIASDPKDARKLRSVLADDLIQVESFIRYYEARMTRELSSVN